MPKPDKLKPVSWEQDRRTGKFKLFAADGTLVTTVDQATVDRVKKCIELHRVGDKNIHECVILAGTCIKTYYRVTSAMPNLKDTATMTNREKARILGDLYFEMASKGKAFPQSSYDLMHILAPDMYPCRKKLAEHGIMPVEDGIWFSMKLLENPKAAKLIRELKRFQDDLDREDRQDKSNNEGGDSYGQD